jgi:hypothetical protein
VILQRLRISLRLLQDTLHNRIGHFLSSSWPQDKQMTDHSHMTPYPHPPDRNSEIDVQ